MRYSHEGVQKSVQVRARKCACLRIPRACLCVERFFLAMVSCLVFVLPVCCQDSGSEVNEFHGSGAEITVTVHDSSGEPISSAAMVKLYRDGTILSRQTDVARQRLAGGEQSGRVYRDCGGGGIPERTKGSLGPRDGKNAGGRLLAATFGWRKDRRSTSASAARTESEGSARKRIARARTRRERQKSRLAKRCGWRPGIRTCCTYKACSL